MKEWQGISEFVATAETNSFSAAAERLDMSVAQVSRNVAALESRLKMQLLYRSTRSVSLTGEGKLYLPHCQHLVASLREANQLIQQRNEQPQGLIRVTAPVYYGEQIIAPLLNQFLQRYDDLRLDLNLTNDTLDLIEGSYDLAIRLGHLGNPRLRARRLGSRRHYIVGSPHYFRRYGQPQTIDDLAQHRCFTGTVRQWRFQQQGKTQSLVPESFIHCNNGLALRDAAIRGLGLAMLPDYYVSEALAKGELEEVLAAYRQDDDGIWALYPESRQQIPKVRVLLDFLIEKLG
ncbi:LysR family transcriptional regulator [Idiomarina aquatica]|uniref:LysR family transcriptional regulator n=1 Tax=Idiomarina aquatica TaxID=1327752 RepID=A0A4R6P2Y2_9GAMM|nr:LysR family transcriptional regulator [Idiomarina aquatica]MAK72168.1 LysR family transcriptional regulator [Idiomarinaceae bacterium]TDP31625.1 LysR family transcriptional regulator [Idiomarina aquatica]HAD49531.1 LysR family transcriptional regulator [Idiomarina sp.]